MTEKTFTRLSDRILSALELAVSQKDKEAGRLLAQALEQSMTRNSGGGEFVERRTYEDKITEILDELARL
jgi:hypothetical protein